MLKRLLKQLVTVTVFLGGVFVLPAIASTIEDALSPIAGDKLDSAEFLLGAIVGFATAIWKLKLGDRLEKIEQRQKTAIENQARIYDTIIYSATGKSNAYPEAVRGTEQRNRDRLPEANPQA